MQNITLICTAHIEFGNSNSKELYNIFEKINPEIIFEEFDSSRTDDEYYKNGHYKNQKICSLETTTIMKYLENHQIIHIPVDTYETTDIPEDMYQKIADNNEEYNNLLKTQFELLSRKGLLFLNSVEHIDLVEKLHSIEQRTIKKLNDEKLFNAYKLWQSVTNNRENEMIKNIYNYSKNHNYNTAIFIVGAEHKKSIIDKIQDYEINIESKINWNYNFYKNISK